MHCLFDFDGTLFDTSKGIITSAKYALQKLKIPIGSDDELRTFIGPPLLETFKVQFELNDDDAIMATKLFREFYGKEGVYLCHPYKGIKETLSILKRKGVRLYVATSKPTVFTNAILSRYKMNDCFDDVVGSNLDNSRSKKVDIIKYILEKRDITDLKDVYMIGDKKQDYIGARDADVNFIGVLYGFGSEDEFPVSSILCKSVGDLESKIISLLKREKG